MRHFNYAKHDSGAWLGQQSKGHPERRPCRKRCSCYVLAMPRRFPPPWSIVRPLVDDVSPLLYDVAGLVKDTKPREIDEHPCPVGHGAGKIEAAAALCACCGS